MLCDYLAAAVRALDAYLLCDLLCILTLRIVRAGIKAAVPSAAKHHVRAALFTLHPVGCGSRLLGRCAVARGSFAIERACIAAGRIVRACGKLSVSAVLDYHRRAALVAYDVGLLVWKLDLFLGYV